MPMQLYTNNGLAELGGGGCELDLERDTKNTFGKMLPRTTNPCLVRFSLYSPPQSHGSGREWTIQALKCEALWADEVECCVPIPIQWVQIHGVTQSSQ